MNHQENLLFGFLGALVALILCLWVYEIEIQDELHPNRQPASVGHMEHSPTRTSTEEPIDPYQYFPDLY